MEYYSFSSVTSVYSRSFKTVSSFSLFFLQHEVTKKEILCLTHSEAVSQKL